jgi:hypothetical protein
MPEDSEPSEGELLAFIRFAHECADLAEPPPPYPRNAAAFARIGIRHYDVFEPKGVTLAMVIDPYLPPFDSSEILKGPRAERVAQLHKWLKQFPCLTWLKNELPIRAGLQALKRVAKTKGGQSIYADDCAEFRYWSLAAGAVLASNSESKPQPIAKQRDRAVKQAKWLAHLIDTTSLFKSVGVDFKDGNAVRVALEKIASMPTEKARAKRGDVPGPVERLS